MVDFSDYSELIDKYLAGGMSENERKGFEQELSVSPELQKMVNDTKLIKKAIIAVERERILTEVQKVAKEFNNGTNVERGIAVSKTRKMLIRNLSIAASIVILVSVGIVSLIKNNTSSYITEYTPYVGYEKLSARGDTRSEDDPVEVLNNAWELYNSKKYKRSLKRIESVTDPGYFEADFLFLKGLCLIEGQKYKDAIEALSVAANSRFRYTGDAQWYLGLTYLEIGEKEKAQTVLVKIRNPNEDVKKVLEEIK